MTTLRVVIILIIIPFSSVLPLSIGLYSMNPVFTEIFPYLALLPAGLIAFFGFRGKYDDLDEFIKSDDEITVNEFQSIITIAYLEIIAIIVVIIIYHILPLPWKIGPLQPVTGGYQYLPPVVYPFIASIYITFVSIYGTYFRKDFGFHFARKSIMALKAILLVDEKREVEIIQYLMVALKWYNKFIRRNLKLEFDSAKVCSSILSKDDKKRVLLRLVDSFGCYHKTEPLDDSDDTNDTDDKANPIINKLKQIGSITTIKRIEYTDDIDKLKPINCLSKIVNLPSSESFLTQKKLSTITKEIVTLLVGIIPVLIAVLQFIQPIFK